jgi:hypothetical protein
MQYIVDKNNKEVCRFCKGGGKILCCDPTSLKEVVTCLNCNGTGIEPHPEVINSQ